jgi:hypothetical protein
VWPEAHHGFVTGKIGRREVFVLVVAFVVMLGHADKLTSQNAKMRRLTGNILT